MFSAEFWSDHVENNPPYQVFPLADYPMQLDGNNQWAVQIGTEVCDPSDAVICNGPLEPMTDFILWVAGATDSGHAILTHQLTENLTTSDGATP